MIILAASGDQLTLTIASDENINSPTVSMLGSTADVTVTQGATANNWCNKNCHWGAY